MNRTQTINKVVGQNQLGVVLVIFGILGRLIPHIPNVTPLTSICLIAGANLSRWGAFLVLSITMFISDIILALMFGYPIFNYCTLFTYTGFVVITFVDSKLQCSQQSLPIYVCCSSLGFWIWTNFGVWITSNLYPKTLVGLSGCYIAALPFLRNSLIGDMIWGLVIFGFLKNFSRLMKRNIGELLYSTTTN
ncbi:MAG: hypothetical protein LBK93_03840 [Rickettsiales bacterium]|nr:hypothetical protein [Rickettsiales bacterium]